MSRDDRSDTNYPEWDQENPPTINWLVRTTPKVTMRDKINTIKKESEADDLLQKMMDRRSKLANERHLVNQERNETERAIRFLRARKRYLHRNPGTDLL